MSTTAPSAGTPTRPRPGGRPAATGRPRLPGLDGVRGLAVLAVVTYHFVPSALPGGFVGVDVFFVLSGFLVSRALVREVLATGRLDVAAFGRRRLVRLVPALLVLLVVVCASSWVWRDGLRDVGAAALSSVFFVHNWWLVLAERSYFETTGRPSALQHLWSLGIEGQFYLLWPPALALVLLPAAWRATDRRVRPGRAVLLALVLAAASAAAMGVLAVRDGVPYDRDGSSLYYATTTHAAAILLGSALGCGVAGRGARAFPRGARGNLVLGLCGALSLGALGWFAVDGSAFSPWTYRIGFTVVALLGSVTVLAAAAPDGPWPRVVGCRPLRWLGVRSYSIYLWHWPVAVVTRPGLDLHLPPGVDLLLRVPATLALGVASHHWFEDPARWRSLLRAGARTLRRTGPADHRRARVAGTSVVAVLLVAALAAAVLGPLAAPAAPAPPRPVEVPALPPVAAPAPTPGTYGLTAVSAYGDSVLLGAQGALGRAFPAGVAVDAVVGRQPRAILADLVADEPHLQPTVLVQVGNNGAVDPARLRAAVGEVAAGHRVLLLTVGVDRAWRDQVNDAVLAAAQGLPTVAVVRWDDLAAAHPGWTGPDGLHLTAAGAAGMAAAVASAAARTPGP